MAFARAEELAPMKARNTELHSRLAVFEFNQATLEAQMDHLMQITTPPPGAPPLTPPPSPPAPIAANCFVGPTAINFASTHYVDDSYGTFGSPAACWLKIYQTGPRAGCAVYGGNFHYIVNQIGGECYCGTSSCCGGSYPTSGYSSHCQKQN